MGPLLQGQRHTPSGGRICTTAGSSACCCQGAPLTGQILGHAIGHGTRAIAQMLAQLLKSIGPIRPIHQLLDVDPGKAPASG